jgi:phosphonate transport system ATP-binding protein
MDDFKRINESMQITIVANMHHVDLAMQYAHRIIGLKAGELVFDGPVSEVTEAILLKIYGRALTEKEKLGEVKKEATE